MKTVHQIINKASAEILQVTGLEVSISFRLVNDEILEAQVSKFFEDMCSCWDVDLPWICKKGRADERPLMKKVLWMAGRQKFPMAPYRLLGFITGTTDHTTVMKGISSGRDWLQVRDQKFMNYYKKVKYFFDEPVDEQI